MKSLILSIFIIILSGCNPKVTVTDTQGRAFETIREAKTNSVTVTDSQGRIFEKVREAKTNSNGVIDIELWQIKGKIGHGYPVYIKLLTEQPTFTLAQ